MLTTEQLKAKRATLIAAARAFLDERTKDGKALSKDDSDKIVEMREEIKTIGEELERDERADAEARQTIPESRRFMEPGEDAGGPSKRWLPTLQESRALSLGVDAQGGFDVNPEMSQQIYDRLRAATVMLRLPGLQSVTMASTTMLMPRLSASATAAMVGEGAQILGQ